MGDYIQSWDGNAYGLAHLEGHPPSYLVTDRGVASGTVFEINLVTDFNEYHQGSPRDSNDPGCVAPGDRNHDKRSFRKAQHGFPAIGLGPLGAFDFGKPYDSLIPDACGSLSSEAGNYLREVGNHHWMDYGNTYLRGLARGLSARALANGGSEKVTCVEHSRAQTATHKHSGFYASSVNIVYFPPEDLKRQQRHLTGFVGDMPDITHRGVDKLENAWFTNDPASPNGCHKG
jgi:hypothetical protein